MSQKQGGAAIFSEEFRSTWYLLAIPGITIGLTVITYLSIYLHKKIIRAKAAKEAHATETFEERKDQYEEPLPEIQIDCFTLDNELLASRPSVSFLEARRSSAVVIE